MKNQNTKNPDPRRLYSQKGTTQSSNRYPQASISRKTQYLQKNSESKINLSSQIANKLETTSASYANRSKDISLLPQRQQFDIIDNYQILSNSESERERPQQKYDDYFEDEVKTDYPYGKKYIINLFKQKHIPKEPAFNMQRCKQQIKDHLHGMADYEYDFVYKEWNFKGRRYWKEIDRKVYIRFQCRRCRENGMNKRWTSILGTAEIKFRVEGIQEFLKRFPRFLNEDQTPRKFAKGMKYPNMVRWELNVFRMECKTCHQWGQPSLYETQLRALCLSFCYIIAQVLAGAEAKKRPKDDRHKIQEVHKHEEDLCQACKVGKCFNIPKSLSQAIPPPQN